MYVFDLARSRERVTVPIIAELERQSSDAEPQQVVSVAGRVKIAGDYPLEPGMTVSDLLRNATNMMRDPSVSEEEVAKMLATALQESARNLDAPPQQLYKELEGLASYIQNTRTELAALHAAGNATAEHIPSASDELDAVVAATEEATNTIMNCCDDIGAVAGRVVCRLSSQARRRVAARKRTRSRAPGAPRVPHSWAGVLWSWRTLSTPLPSWCRIIG